MQTFKQPDVQPSVVSMTPPAYPVAEAWNGLAGQVMLLVAIDESGVPTRVEVEQTSGVPGLDQVALESAGHWRFVPGMLKGEPISALVRVPVRFEVPEAYRPDRISNRPKDAHFNHRRAAHAVAPALDAEGLLPAYIADLYPPGVSTVAAAKALLQRYAHQEPDALPGIVSEYTLRDEEGLSYWNLVSAGPAAPSVVRRRLVGDEQGQWFVTSFLCEADAAGCAQLEQLMKNAPSQPKMPTLDLPPQSGISTP